MLADRYELAKAQQKKLQKHANGQPRLALKSGNGQMTKSLQSLSGYFRALQQEETTFKAESDPCCHEPKIIGA